MGESSGEPSKKRRRRKRDKHSVVAADEDNVKTSAASDDEGAAPQNDEDGGGADAANPADADGDDGAGATEGQNEGAIEGDDATTETKKRKRKRKRKKKSGDDDANGAADGGAAPNEPDATKLQSMEHTVFVEGLPFSSNEEEVRSFFVEHGCGDILQLRLPTWQDSGRLRGYGHVVFASTETRTRALGDELNGKNLGGRYVTIKEANAPRAGTSAGAALGLGGGRTREQPKGCRTVHVRNLPYDASEYQIEEAFRAFGKIADGGLRIARNHVTGTSKGFAYVEFKNEESAHAAVEKAAKPFGLLVMKRPVFVDYDEGAVKGSYRDSGGRLWSKEHGGAGLGGQGRGGGGRGGRGGGPGFGKRGARK